MGFIITLAILTLIAAGAWKFLKFQTEEDELDSRGYRTGSKKRTPFTLPNRIAGWSALGLAVLTLIVTGANTVYKNDVGEARVIKSFTGQLVDFNDQTGLGIKSPFDDAIVYDILNQQVVFSKPENVKDEMKEFVKGGEITITDKDGVSANVDAVIRYSLRGDRVMRIAEGYVTQNNFEARLITQDLREAVRNTPNAFNTNDVLTKRGEISAAILETLNKKWVDEGVQVESIALQDIRYPESIMKNFEAAQNARTTQITAAAELEATKISAQQKVVQAQAESDANAILAKSLTPEILKQRELDTMRAIGEKGNSFYFSGNGVGTPTPVLPVAPK